MNSITSVRPPPAGETAAEPSAGERSRSRPKLPRVHVSPAGREQASHYVIPPHQPFSLELLRTADTFIAGVVLVAVFLAVNASHFSFSGAEFLLLRVSIKNLLLMFGFVGFWQLLFTVFGLYDPRVLRRRSRELHRVLVATAVGSVAVLAISLVELSSAFPMSIAGYFLVVASAATILVRTVVREVSVRSRAWTVKEILIVGSGPRAYKLFRDLQAAPDSGYQLLGFVDTNPAIELKEIRQRLLGTLDELETILMRHPIDQVLIALPIRSCYSEIEDVIRTCERVGVESKYFADVFQNAFARPRYDATHGPAVSLKVVPDDARLFVKRAFDILFASVALLLLSPVLITIAAAIRLTSPGPVIFSQWRYGKNRRLFRMYKFRTMVPDAENLQMSLEHLNEVGGPVFKIVDDPRITPVGRFLRRTSLDELPQLYNVLRGEMSIVGPRPLPTRDVHRFSEGRLMRRFSVVPGLTCLWQISGRSAVGFDEWLRLDLSYIDRWSLTLDLTILIRTIPVVLRGTGAS